MLIPSPRHTPADLALWAEYEEADRALAQSHAERLNRLFGQTVETIHRWDSGGGYLGTSWGKDSVVLMHAAAEAKVSVSSVWVRMRGRENPDCLLVRDAFLEQFPLRYIEREFVYEECSHDEHWAALAREFGNRRLTGLRMDESGTRKMSVLRLGIDTGASCRPLAYWRSDDIFAWCAANDLPLHPAYACLGGGRWPRKYLRTHAIGGSSGSNRGRADWEREYYAM
jgi:phosphoadenosine phosphosulfate reductase